MLGLEIIKSDGLRRRATKSARATAFLLTSLLSAATVHAAAYYSSAAPTVATPSTCGLPATCGGVQVATAAQLASLTLAASVYAAQSPVRLQLPLAFPAPSASPAPAGFRAGMLVSSLGSLASLDALGTVTLRTYLDNAQQETQLVDVDLLKAMLLAGNGKPQQLEFTSKLPFNRVELELGSVTSQIGAGLKVQYAYGVEPNVAQQVAGYVSRFASPTNQFDTNGCTTGIKNPERAVDQDLTNYASFASLLTVSCPEKLQVNLEGTSPAGYRAGFVIGGLDNVLNADLLGGLVLKTYRNGMQQEVSAALSPLELSVLPSGQTFVSFPTKNAFDAVSIERVGVVTALDNLQIYYGTGIAATPTTQVRSGWDNTADHYSAFSNGLLCVSLTGCSVANGANAADNNLNNYATLNVATGLASSAGLRLDLNGGGNAGNRAGMVLAHQGGLLDASALSRVVLSTYDAKGNVLETKSGSSLLKLDLLPDGRQTVSFNSTRDFASVGVSISGLLNVLDNTNIYYAFADDSNGQVAIVSPAKPLPVSLTSFGVRRLASSGAAAIAWATASEANSASFIVERATNPAADFVAIGQVAAAGNSTLAHSYALTDKEAATQVNTLYYRLRQVDTDGRAHLSAVVVLAAGPVTASFTLYPNPAPASGQRITLGTSTSLRAGYSVQLYAATGQLLSSQVMSSESAAIAPTVSTTGLAVGIYHVVLRDASGQQVAAQRLQIAEQ